jgi:hypothetical protein
MPNATVYLTLPHNEPSGGVKVVNEFVQLFRSRGHESYVCLPKERAVPATFIRDPAPVLTLDEMVRRSTARDVIISVWHSQQEYQATRSAAAAVKVFWQHGILVPTTPDSAGERVFEPGVFDQYWNVSDACRRFIQAKYQLSSVSIVNPFFDPPRGKVPWSQRSGVLALARRGSEYIRPLRAVVERAGEHLTVLAGRFHDQDLEQMLLDHRFFISVDNGIQRPPRWKLWSPRRRNWVWHKQNLLGFPVTSAQAAMCGNVVLGFAMGGGLEWMTLDNSYIAQDNNLASLLEVTGRCLSSTDTEWEAMAERARQAVSRFSRDHAWSQITAVIGEWLAP